MNFGPGTKVNLKKQVPTYHIAPNFTTRPFPDGPLDLGTLVEDVVHCYPINQGFANRVAIPDGQRYTDVKQDVTASLKQSASGEGSILAKVLDRSIGGDASLKGNKKNEDMYRIERLETVYFYPSASYVSKCLRLQDVEDYMDMADYKEAVYLITGLKIARGATVSTEQGREYEGRAEAHVETLAGPLDVHLGAAARISSETGLASSFGKPADFVLGLQVQKIYHKRAAFFVGKPCLKVKKVVKNAVLVDNDDVPPPPEAVDDEVDEVNFTVADLDSDEIKGLTAWTERESRGQEEVWLLPSDVE